MSEKFYYTYQIIKISKLKKGVLMNILEKLNAIKNQEITAKENVEAYIKVIEEKNEDINAFLELNKEEAIARAEEIDAWDV